MSRAALTNHDTFLRRHHKPHHHPPTHPPHPTPRQLFPTTHLRFNQPTRDHRSTGLSMTGHPEILKHLMRTLLYSSPQDVHYSNSRMYILRVAHAPFVGSLCI